MSLFFHKNIDNQHVKFIKGKFSNQTLNL